MAITVTNALDPRRGFQANGVSNFDRNDGELVVYRPQDPDDAAAEVIWQAEDALVQLGPEREPQLWLRVDRHGPDPALGREFFDPGTSDPMRWLDALALADEPEHLEDTTLDGEAVRLYRTTVEAQQLIASPFDAHAGHRVPVWVWVDEHDRLRRLASSLQMELWTGEDLEPELEEPPTLHFPDTDETSESPEEPQEPDQPGPDDGSARATSTIDFFDFGVAVDVEPPANEHVEDLEDWRERHEPDLREDILEEPPLEVEVLEPEPSEP